MVAETYSEKDTFDLARDLAGKAQKGDVIALIGDLGAGKTAFAKGFAAGLGINEPVVSPTFTIMQMYEGGRLPLYHFDVYRIGDISELEETGYEDCFWGEGVTILEWADLVEPILPGSTTMITIERDLSKGNDYRKITIENEDDRH